MIIHQTSQVMHCQVTHLSSHKSLFCSFIYAANDHQEGKDLWKDLEVFNRFVKGKPWSLMGDFNVALNIEDSSAGFSGLPRCMVDFKDCVKNIEVSDLNQSGLHYTWNQESREGKGILKKLDRIMVNEFFFSRIFVCSCYFSSV